MHSGWAGPGPGRHASFQRASPTNVVERVSLKYSRSRISRIASVHMTAAAAAVRNVDAADKRDKRARGPNEPRPDPPICVRVLRERSASEVRVHFIIGRC